MKYVVTIIYCTLIIIQLDAGRSIFRTKDPNIPTLSVRWNNNNTLHILQDSHLEEWPLFHTFDRHHFEHHMLPEQNITYRYNEKQTVSGATLGTLIQTALDEIRQGKKVFTHFTVLKKRDFHKGTGLIILKFKDYPFVAKLSIETPDSFISSWEKGFESTCFFYMGGGINRHLLGFTRIKNLEHLQNKLDQHPYWYNKVSFPRKWFWKPANALWLTLKGKNIGSGTPATEIPSVYAVVADYINIERTLTLTERKDRRTAFALSSYFKSAIDSHINNFVEEKETKKVAILDTEHFPTLVGLRENPRSQSYLQWYTHLASKMVNNLFGRNKYERYAIQKGEPSPMHIALSVDGGTK